MWVREGLVEKVTFKLIQDCHEAAKFCKELGVGGGDESIPNSGDAERSRGGSRHDGFKEMRAGH